MVKITFDLPHEEAGVMSDSENHQNGMFPEWEKGSEKSGNSADALHLIETGKPNGKQHLDFTDNAVVNRYETSDSVDTHKEDDDEEISLLHGCFEKIPMKDFHAEIRAYKDVEDFLNSTLLLLNLQQTGLTEIIDAMLKKLHENSDEGSQFTLEEARHAIFTQDSVHTLSRTIQGTTTSEDSGFDFDQSWICAMCELSNLTKRHVVIARLAHPANLGSTSQEVQLVILVLTPTVEKSTKSALETARTFSTLFLDMDYRHKLLEVQTESEFKQLLQQRTKLLSSQQGLPENRKSHLVLSDFEKDEAEESKCPLGRGMINDLKRRLPHYWSDYKDGIFGKRTIHKVISTTFFLYFACVLPNIAFGMLNDSNTDGAIGVQKILFSQCLGGLLFAVFGGQPLIVLLTTAPLALYTKIIYSISDDFGLDFNAMFACVGLWNAFFLIIYSVFNLSKLMKYSSRSTEEIFSLFIVFAFSADAIKDTVKDFNKNYYSSSCDSLSQGSFVNQTNISAVTTQMPSTNLSDTTTAANMIQECLKENSILFLLLMLGTVWLGITLYNFTKTPFLNAGKREMLADYALPVAVLAMSFFGSFVFKDIKLKPFTYRTNVEFFVVAPIHTLPWGAVLGAAGLGFCLSLLFFMDQNISSALVNAPANKLKKGAAYHWDLFTVAIINAFLSIFTFPWVHAALPHSPLHVKALADMEDRVDQGHVHQIVVYVRETRLTGIISHIMIGLSLLLLPYPMSYIPRPVLDGLFLYIAITALFGNQMFDRIMLFFTEQAAYPPNHYIRRVPQRKIHLFTVTQILQLFVLCIFGFSPIPYMKMVFPILIMLLMPIRHKLTPKFIEPKYLKALDGH
ncbi:solute carrier family 4 member 11-like isoform X1 [Mytilus californianus]|uniref:solute carrier family 4 member 11-like isoform X1 n=2 Tax=Mytilus californianus TaxID=6549 RepID=UPI0022454A5B|nr:solute carrier family 4 member 11-like isoform X1 [Mytilus californianus]